ncbi:hypothetical protein QOT17_022338 [Balamuthia mandrillaris]
MAEDDAFAFPEDDERELAVTFQRKNKDGQAKGASRLRLKKASASEEPPSSPKGQGRPKQEAESRGAAKDKAKGKQSSAAASSKKKTGSSTKEASAWKSVKVLVDVKDRDKATKLKSDIEAMGGKVMARMSPNLTHVVFEEGKKAVWEKANEHKLPVVSPEWVAACKGEDTVLSVEGYAASTPAASSRKKKETKKGTSKKAAGTKEDGEDGETDEGGEDLGELAQRGELDSDMDIEEKESSTVGKKAKSDHSKKDEPPSEARTTTQRGAAEGKEERKSIEEVEEEGEAEEEEEKEKIIEEERPEVGNKKEDAELAPASNGKGKEKKTATQTSQKTNSTVKPTAPKKESNKSGGKEKELKDKGKEKEDRGKRKRDNQKEAKGASPKKKQKAANEVASKGKRKGKKQKDHQPEAEPEIIIVPSYLTFEQKTQLDDISRQLKKAAVIWYELGHKEEEWASITHVIVGDEKRTLKVLGALATGAFIVKFDWIMACAEAGEWLPVNEFQASDWFPGTTKSVAAHLNGERGLFTGSTFAVQGKTKIPVAILRNLIMLSGGKVIKDVSKADYCIASEPSMARRVRAKHHSNQKLTIVPEEWFLDALKYYTTSPKATLTNTYKPEDLDNESEEEEEEQPKQSKQRRSSTSSGGSSKKAKTPRRKSASTKNEEEEEEEEPGAIEGTAEEKEEKMNEEEEVEKQNKQKEQTNEEKEKEEEEEEDPTARIIEALEEDPTDSMQEVAD